MNLVILMGRLTKDPEVRYSQGEKPTAIARYTLAVKRVGASKEKGEQADFINCVAFGHAGEFAEKYFRQGMRILVFGKMQTGSYINRDGVKIYTTNVIILSQDFADSKRGGDSALPAAKEASIGDGFMEIPDNINDEGLPFN